MAIFCNSHKRTIAYVSIVRYLAYKTPYSLEYKNNQLDIIEKSSDQKRPIFSIKSDKKSIEFSIIDAQKSKKTIKTLMEIIKEAQLLSEEQGYHLTYVPSLIERTTEKDRNFFD